MDVVSQELEEEGGHPKNSKLDRNIIYFVWPVIVHSNRTNVSVVQSWQIDIHPVLINIIIHTYTYIYTYIYTHNTYKSERNVTLLFQVKSNIFKKIVIFYNIYNIYFVCLFLRHMQMISFFFLSFFCVGVTEKNKKKSKVLPRDPLNPLYLLFFPFLFFFILISFF